MSDFPSRLRALREEKDMLQRELAEKLNLSRIAITHYEKGNRFPEWDTLKKIADFFGVTVDYLLGRTNSRTSIEQSSKIETQAAHRSDDPMADLPPEAQKSLDEFKDFILRKYGKKKE